MKVNIAGKPRERQHDLPAVAPADSRGGPAARAGAFPAARSRTLFLLRDAEPSSRDADSLGGGTRRAGGAPLPRRLCIGGGVLVAHRRDRDAGRRIPVRTLAWRPPVGDWRDTGIGGRVPGGAHGVLRSLPR